MTPADAFNANYGCVIGNWGCMAQEMMANTVGGIIKNMGDFMADMFVEAFKNTGVSETDWGIADGQFWFWVKIMAVVLLVVGVLQMTAPVILADGKRLLMIGLGFLLAVPTSVFAVIAMRKLVGYSDLVTSDIVASLQGGEMADSLLRLFGWKLDNKGVAHVIETSDSWTSFASSATLGVTGLGHWVITLLIMGVIAIASMFLQLAMAIRAFGLIALAATAPIAWMMIGQPKLAAWASRWVTLALGLLFAKPLAAAILVLGVNTFGATDTFATQIVAAGVIFVAAFSPAWAVGLVAFTSAEGRSALQNRPSVTNLINKLNIGSSALGRLRRRR